MLIVSLLLWPFAFVYRVAKFALVSPAVVAQEKNWLFGGFLWFASVVYCFALFCYAMMGYSEQTPVPMWLSGGLLCTNLLSCFTVMARQAEADKKSADGEFHRRVDTFTSMWDRIMEKKEDLSPDEADEFLRQVQILLEEDQVDEREANVLREVIRNRRSDPAEKPLT